MASKTPDRDTIFCSAIEIPSADERAAFIRGMCADDAELRQQVEKLVEAHFQAGSFLERPVDASSVTGPFAPSPEGPASGTLPEGPGTRIGPYKLLQLIGEGGMGSVFMAQQTEPVKRLVAIKVIKPGMDSRQVLARFEAERQALALMDHPHIAKVLDAGATATGRPFFVMELIKGVPITGYCDEHRLTPRQRLELFVPVCRAIQHAHHKGIIHRDIKPSNVLVALYDGNPVPKVIDFGVAKATGPQLTELTLVTGFGVIVGTLEYMSPEQAELNQLDIDTRCDIYALGVLLYELLTGTTPLEKNRLKQAAMSEALRIIREEEPLKPSTRLSSTEQLPSIAANRGLEPRKLSLLVRGDLDWIVMKCLEKDRNRRYETANALVLDTLRYLHDEPVQASPPSAGYRFRKFARRNKRALWTTLMVLLAMLLVLAGVAGSVGWAVRDRAARQAGLEVEVRRALDEVQASHQRGGLLEAMAAVKRAEGLLATGARDEPLRERVRQWRTDLDLVVRLEEIRQERSALQKERYDYLTADAAYREAFRKYLDDPETTDLDKAIDYLKSAVVKEQLLAGLDDWVMVKWRGQLSGLERLLALVRRMDADPWRDRFREAFLRRDRNALVKLAEEKDVAVQPRSAALLLGLALAELGEVQRAIEVLHQAQRRYPDDFWINVWLAAELMQVRPARLEEAVGFFRVGVAIRPQSPGNHVDLGTALYSLGKIPEAEAEYREAARLKSDYAMAHYNLGIVFYRQGKLEQAVGEYLEAVRLRPDFPQARNNLGIVYLDQDKPDKAEAHLRLAVRQDPKYADARHTLAEALEELGKLSEAIQEYREASSLAPGHPIIRYNFGAALLRQGNPAAAAVEFREAIRLKEDYAEAYCQLGRALEQQGDFRGALSALKRGHRLGVTHTVWREPSAEWVREAERLVAVEDKLPALRKGEYQPRDNGERLALARACQLKQWHLTAARLFTDAFAAEPKVADDLKANHRYNAASAAAQIGARLGADDKNADEASRARWRGQAIAWLQANLSAYDRLLATGKPADRTFIQEQLAAWQTDSNLSNLRDPASLAGLAMAERDSCRKLWVEVEQLLAKVRSPR